MRLKKRSIIQLSFTILIVISCIIYSLYLRDKIDFRLLSIGDLNPYGGWTALKSLFIDVSYRWSGISRAIALTIALSLTSLIFGRFFCGFICPIGALEDFLKFIGKKIGIKESYIPNTLEIIKYLILIILLILSIVGLGNEIYLLSPWIGYLGLISGLHLSLSVVLLLLIISSLFTRRLFCRVFCPLGAFQALLYGIGPLKIHKNTGCGSCTHCLKDCPVNIKTIVDDTISPECVNCLKCTETKCFKDTSGYKLKFGGKNIGSRLYILLSLSIFIIIYSFLPITKTNTLSQTISQIENLKDGTYIGLGTGFGGNIHTKIIIENKKIKDISVINHRETSGYYEEVFKELSKDIKENQTFNVDLISGATVTSRGFINSVKGGISQSIEN